MGGLVLFACFYTRPPTSKDKTMKDYYQLELDDMVIELNNKDEIIEEQEQKIIELEE